MITIKDVKGIPDELLKKDTLDVYKAYLFSKETDEDHKMTINENVDMFGITPEAAVKELLHVIPTEDFVKQMDGGLDEITGGDGLNENLKWLYSMMTIHVDGKTDGSDICTVEMTDIVVPILIIKINMDDLKNKDLIEDAEEAVFHDDTIGLTLKDKQYDMECETQRLLSFKLVINADGTRLIEDIKLELDDEPRKKRD